MDIGVVKMNEKPLKEFEKLAFIQKWGIETKLIILSKFNRFCYYNYYI